MLLAVSLSRPSSASIASCVKVTPVLIQLKSKDVLHSFFLPQMRIKQDAVPGLTIPVWFDADEAGHYEIVCAELCGWGHYKMKGGLTVHETQAQFDEWMKRLRRHRLCFWSIDQSFACLSHRAAFSLSS